LQVFDLDHALRVLALDVPRSLHREVLSVTVAAWCAIDSNFELSAVGHGLGKLFA
jgi:hypothetical protein